jgi:ribosomal protein S19
MLAQELHVDEDTLTNWKKREGFQEAVKAAARNSLIDHLPSFYGALIRMADAGHYEHLKLAFEMTGEYVKVNKNINENEGQMTVRFVIGEAQPIAQLTDEDD